MQKGDVSIEFLVKAVFVLLLLVVLLWAIGAIGGKSFSLLDKLKGLFMW